LTNLPSKFYSPPIRSTSTLKFLNRLDSQEPLEQPLTCIFIPGSSENSFCRLRQSLGAVFAFLLKIVFDCGCSPSSKIKILTSAADTAQPNLQSIYGSKHLVYSVLFHSRDLRRRQPRFARNWMTSLNASGVHVWTTSSFILSWIPKNLFMLRLDDELESNLGNPRASMTKSIKQYNLLKVSLGSSNVSVSSWRRIATAPRLRCCVPISRNHFRRFEAKEISWKHKFQYECNQSIRFHISFLHTISNLVCDRDCYEYMPWSFIDVFQHTCEILKSLHKVFRTLKSFRNPKNIRS